MLEWKEVNVHSVDEDGEYTDLTEKAYQLRLEESNSLMWLVLQVKPAGYTDLVTEQEVYCLSINGHFGEIFTGNLDQAKHRVLMLAADYAEAAKHIYDNYTKACLTDAKQHAKMQLCDKDIQTKKQGNGDG